MLAYNYPLLGLFWPWYLVRVDHLAVAAVRVVADI